MANKAWEGFGINGFGKGLREEGEGGEEEMPGRTCEAHVQGGRKGLGNHEEGREGEYTTDDLVFHFRVPSAHIFTCSAGGGFLPDGFQASLALPKNGEWVASGAIRVAPADDGSGSPDASTCVVTIPVQRNFFIFVTKQVIPSTMIVYMGLCAMFISADEHTGDRAALIGVSALIVMINFQTELLIGELPYLVWWDLFNLFAFVILILALLESVVEHRYIVHDEEDKANALNTIARFGLLIGIYPAMLYYLFVAGLLADYASPIALAPSITVFIATVILSRVLFGRKLGQQEDNRADVIKKLKLCAPPRARNHYIQQL